MDVGFIHATKMAKGIHTRNGTGYIVWATEAEIRHWEGVMVVWRAVKGSQEGGIQGEFSINFGGETIVRCRGTCAAKRRASRALRGAGNDSGAKGVKKY